MKILFVFPLVWQAFAFAGGSLLPPVGQYELWIGSKKVQFSSDLLERNSRYALLRNYLTSDLGKKYLVDLKEDKRFSGFFYEDHGETKLKKFIPAEYKDTDTGVEDRYISPELLQLPEFELLFVKAKSLFCHEHLTDPYCSLDEDDDEEQEKQWKERTIDYLSGDPTGLDSKALSKRYQQSLLLKEDLHLHCARVRTEIGPQIQSLQKSVDQILEKVIPLSRAGEAKAIKIAELDQRLRLKDARSGWSAADLQWFRENFEKGRETEVGYLKFGPLTETPLTHREIIKIRENEKQIQDLVVQSYQKDLESYRIQMDIIHSDDKFEEFLKNISGDYDPAVVKVLKKDNQFRQKVKEHLSVSIEKAEKAISPEGIKKLDYGTGTGDFKNKEWLNVDQVKDQVIDATNADLSRLSSPFMSKEHNPGHQDLTSDYPESDHEFWQLQMKAERFFVPLHSQGHYSLAEIRPKEKNVFLYDSMGAYHNDHSVYEEMILKLIAIAQAEKIPFPTEEDWRIVRRAAPQQTNTNDCGIYTILAAQRLAKNEPLNYTVNDIPHVRARFYGQYISRALNQLQRQKPGPSLAILAEQQLAAAIRRFLKENPVKTDKDSTRTLNF